MQDSTGSPAIAERVLLTPNERQILNSAGFSWGCFFFGVWWSLYTRTWRALWLQLVGYLGVVAFAFVLGVLDAMGVLGGYLGVGKSITLTAWGATHVYIAWNARAWRAARLKRTLGLPA